MSETRETRRAHFVDICLSCWQSMPRRVFGLLVYGVLLAFAQELVPLVPSQEQEIVDAHNEGRLSLDPLPCTPLLTVGWDAILAEAAKNHSLDCMQVLQSQSQRRNALERTVRDLNIEPTSSAIGKR